MTTLYRVKYASNTETGERVAIKILDKEKIMKQNMGEQIKKEISIMKVVKHHNVVGLKEVLASRTKIFIVLELITGGELFDKIVAQGRLDEASARSYFQQLISGVEYCHRQGVCHRDLKPENLLLDSEGTLKISDFGLSALFSGTEKDSKKVLLHTTCGTPNYVAPEVLSDKGYDGKAADVWSCGVILYVLLAGFLPFDEPNMSTLFRKIMKAEYTFPPWFSVGAKALLQKLLVPSPSKRCSLADIKQDEWFCVGLSEERRESLKPDAPVLVSDADIDAAFEATDEIVEEKAVQPPVPELAVGGAKPLAVNAFELITMSRGLDLSPLFVDKNKDVKRITTFNSGKPPSEIMKRLVEELQTIKATYKVFDDTFKIKVSMTGTKGIVGATIQILYLAAGMHIVEFRKGKGDIFEYHRLFHVILEKVSDIVVA